jgi:hypothetical protein
LLDVRAPIDVTRTSSTRFTCALAPLESIHCIEPSWGGAVPYLADRGEPRWDSIVVVMPLDTPEPERALVELYDRWGRERVETASTFIPETRLDLASTCSFTAVRYDLEAFPYDRTLLVHRLSSAPPGLTHVDGHGFVSMFDGERALSFTVILEPETADLSQ